jgi:predicted dehydrogenase
MMKKLGVIGACGRGSLAKNAHKPDEGYAITAVCDINEENKETLQEWYGEEVYFTTDYQDLLQQDVEAVFICSPDFLHEEHALAAIAAGKHIYLEKPMAITVEGCDRIMEAAQAKGTKLFIGHNMRYMNIIRKMKQLIDEGAIGEVKSVWCRHFISYGGDAYFRDWHADREKSTGLLLQKGAHDIDVMHWLTGAYSTKVSAFGNLGVYGDLPRAEKEGRCPGFKKENWPPKDLKDFNPVMNVEDQTVMIMEMENGVIGSYLQCHFSPDSCRNYTIIGTEGRIENIGNDQDSPIFVFNKRTDSYKTMPDVLHYADEVDAGGHGGADPLIVAEFLEHITRDGVETVSTPQASRMAVAAGCLATESLRNGGGAREVPPLSDEIMEYRF